MDSKQTPLTVTARVEVSDLVIALGAPKGAAVIVQEIERHRNGEAMGDFVEVSKNYLTGWASCIVGLAATNADLAARVPRMPDFEALKDKRMSELSEQQQDDAHELWMRNQLHESSDIYWGPKVQFLLRRLDEARGVK